jgi:hypothetical protein
MKRDPVDTRAIMVLQNEARRVTESAERVRLVVQAMALRHGLKPVTDESSPFSD